MIKAFNTFMTCKKCGERNEMQTDFNLWLREDKEFVGGHAIVRTDMDNVIVRFATPIHDKDYQLAMVIEVKEFGAAPDGCQEDLMAFLDQAIKLNGRISQRLWSPYNKRDVRVKNFGVQLLQFEKTCPANSAWIKWNGKVITREVLIDLIKMNRRPDDPRLMMIDLLREDAAVEEPLIQNEQLNLFRGLAEELSKFVCAPVNCSADMSCTCRLCVALEKLLQLKKAT